MSKLSKFNPFNLIDLLAKPPKDMRCEKIGMKNEISSIEDLQTHPVYRAKTRRFSYALILILMLDLLAAFFYIDNLKEAEPQLYEISAQNLAKKNSNQYHEKRLMLFNKPRHTEVAIQRWADTVLSDLYHFDFLNYNERLQAVKPYFTDEGFKAYQKALKNADAKNYVEQNKISLKSILFEPLMFPQAFGHQKITEKNENVYYQLYAPMRMTVQKGNVVSEYSVVFNIMLVLLVDSDGKTGFYIHEFAMDRPVKITRFY